MNPIQKAHEEALAAHEEAKRQLQEYRQTWKDVLEGERFLALASVKADTLRIESRVAWEKEQKRLRRAEFEIPPHTRPFLEMLADPSVQGQFKDFGFCTRSGLELQSPQKGGLVGFVALDHRTTVTTTWDGCRRPGWRLNKIWRGEKLVEGHSFQKAVDLVQIRVPFANLLAWQKDLNQQEETDGRQ